MPPLSTDLENIRAAVGQAAGDARELETDHARITAANLALQKRVQTLEALLEALTPAPFLWSDDFKEKPREEPGQYLYAGEDNPTARWSVVPSGLEASLVAGKGHIRSELGRFGPPSPRVILAEDLGVVRWYALTVRLDAAFPAIDHKVVAIQFWPTPDPGEEDAKRNPVLSLEVLKSRMRFVQVVSTTPIQTGNDGLRRELWSGEKTLAKPFRVVLRAVWRPDDQGELEGWINGVPIFAIKGEPSTNADKIGPRFRFGLYCPALRPGEVPPDKAIATGTTFRAIFGRFRVGDEKNKLGDFA